MSMYDWAKNEVELAIKNEMNTIDENDKDSIEYVKGCYESALKAYKSLLDDGHSGFSWGITVSILNKLAKNIPLTPIEDGEEDWNFISSQLEYDLYQHKRKSSLFKETQPNGPIYRDLDRVICVDVDNPNITFTNKFITDIVHNMYPIYFPYTPTKPFKVYRKDFLFDKVDGGDFDTMALMYLITPNGEKVELNKFYKEYKGEYWKEIDISEYLDRLHYVENYNGGLNEH